MAKVILAGTVAHWWIRSNESPMWNCEGMATIRPGGGPPIEVVDKIDELTKMHGDPPEDLDWGYQ